MPPAADLRVAAEPPYPLEALTDPKAESDWNDSVLLWGREGWQQVGRLCRWAQRNGAADLDCPAD